MWYIDDTSMIIACYDRRWFIDDIDKFEKIWKKHILSSIIIEISEIIIEISEIIIELSEIIIGISEIYFLLGEASKIENFSLAEKYGWKQVDISKEQD